MEQGLHPLLERVDPLGLYEEAGRNGADAFTVSLEMELDQPWEQELVRLFVEAAFSRAAIEGMANRDAVVQKYWQSVAELRVETDSIRPLLQGTLQVAFAARRQSRWWAAWNFHHGSQLFQLILKGPDAGRVRHGQFSPWTTGIDVGSRDLVEELVSEMGALGRADFSPFLLRWRDSLDEGIPESCGIDFSHFLESLTFPNYFALQVPPSTNIGIVEPVSLVALPKMLGREQRERTQFEFRFVLGEILRRSLAITNNRRLPLERNFSIEDLGGPVDLRDGSGVAGELYRLRNGSKAEQERFEQARSIFKDITQLDLNLHSRPAADATLEIDILVGSSGSARVAQFSGAGIQETLLLATLIAGDSGRVLVLDEPAVNLHPTMQRRLARHLSAVQGIVITHSPDLVPCSGITDLDRVIRLASHPEGSRVRSLASANREGLRVWMQKLLLTDVRALLFASAVVLFEGATDLGALSQWWKDGAAGFGDPENANISLVEVGGDNNFGGYINYLEAFNIPWAAVADGPAFWHQSGLSKQLSNLGLAPREGRPGEDEGFEAWRKYWNCIGVFTVAEEFGKDGSKSGEFEAFLSRLDRPLLDSSRAMHSKSKPRVGAAFAAARPATPSQVSDLYRQIREHLNAAKP